MSKDDYKDGEPDQIELCSFPFQDEGKWHNATVFCFINTSRPNEITNVSYKDGQITSILHEKSVDDTYSIYQYEDHYDISKDEADEYCEEHEQRIKEYAEFVNETGTDPLENYFCVNRTETKKGTAFVKFGKYIGYDKKGFMVTSVNWQGRDYYALSQLPDHVQKFLCLKRDGIRYIMEGVTSVDQLKECEFCEDLNNYGHNTFNLNIEWEAPRSAEEIAKELRKVTRVSKAKETDK
mgnify:CR=1 FL=1|tara:strand:- start:531 stop:1241 length:711 start_codon:yes stop_codon:yes gene_type:complete